MCRDPCPAPFTYVVRQSTDATPLSLSTEFPCHRAQTLLVTIMLLYGNGKVTSQSCQIQRRHSQVEYQAVNNFVDLSRDDLGCW